MINALSALPPSYEMYVTVIIYIVNFAAKRSCIFSFRYTVVYAEIKWEKNRYFNLLFLYDQKS